MNALVVSFRDNVVTGSQSLPNYFHDIHFRLKEFAICNQRSS